MKRITLPEPEIELYKDGFAKHDKLGRKETGERLSDLLERIDEPLVIALDGAWGSGKSFFLKCWVGEHLQRKGNTTQTVYFDAFKNDYLDDPLIALTAEISERLEREPESQAAKAWQLAKNAAPFLGKAAFRLGTAALVGKAISLTGDEDGALNDIADNMANESGELSKTLTDFWKKEDGRRAAMERFHAALEQLTAPTKKGDPQNKLVIVVDELDRCRPDYALSLLETIKHFFNVPGVHFVLGVNLTELQNSVRARYGDQVDATRYLRKFLSMNLKLQQWNSSNGRHDIAAQHFQRVAIALGIGSEADTFAILFKNLLPKDVSLRDAEHVATAIAVSVPCDRYSDNGAYRIVKDCLTVLYALDPNLFAKVLYQDVTFPELCAFFRLPLELKPDSDWVQINTWNTLAISTGHIIPTTKEEAFTPCGDALLNHDPKLYLALIARHHFGDISIDW